MKFFFDENLSVVQAEALKILNSPDHQIEHVRWRFGPGTEDREWIQALGREGGWIVVSHDRRILTRPEEKELWAASKLRGIFLAKSMQALTGWDARFRLVGWWGKVIQQAQHLRDGQVVQLTAKGKFKPL